MIELSTFLPLAILAALCVGLSKGGMPGIGSIAVPLLALKIDPLTAAALLLPIYLISDAFGLWIYRRDFSPRNLAILIPAGLLGILIGYLAAPYTSVPVMSIFVGCIGLWYCGREWFGGAISKIAKPANIIPGVIWGTLSGITSFISHTGGPPYQMYTLPQRLPKLVFAGTTTILFACINLAKLPPYLALNQFPTFELKSTAVLILAAIFGAFMGAKVTRWVPERIFYLGVQIALFLLSLQLIWKAINDLT